MNRRLFEALGAIAVLIAIGSCAEDPLSDFDGDAAQLVTNFSELHISVGSTSTVTATVLDGRGTALIVPVTFRTCNATASAVVDATYNPVPRTSTRALVTALSYGTSCVIAEAAGLSDTVNVLTFPHSIVIIGPSTVTSGDTTAYTHQYLDRTGNPVAGVPAPTWSTSPAAIGTVSATGDVAAKDTGIVNVTARGPGTTTAGISVTNPVTVIPAPFTVTITPNPADPGQVVKLARAPGGPAFDANTSVRFGTSVQAVVAGSLTPDSLKVAIPDLAVGGVLSVGVARMGATEITQSGGVFTVNTPATLAGSTSPTSGQPGDRVVIRRGSGDPVFDANTRVFFGGVRTFININTADSLVVPVPGIGTVGAVELRLTRLGASDLARQEPFTADTGVFLFADASDDVNDDPDTAPEITSDGDFFVVVSGGCASGVGGTDCDDFFQITNSGGSDAAVTVNAAWLAGPDVDIYGLDPTFDFCTFDDGCAGATGANPESFTMTIPAGETWFIYVNLWAPAGTPSTVVRVRVTGLP